MECSNIHDADRCGCMRCQASERSPDCALDRLAGRIALDLHDGAAQALSALLLITPPAACAECAAAREFAARYLEHLTQALDEVRALIGELHPDSSERPELAARIDTVLREFETDTGIRVLLEFDTDGLRDLRHNTQLAVYRVVQECLNNIRRHASASHVAVRLARDDGHLTGIVSDDGAGMAAAHDAGTTEQRPGMGILGMQERVEALRGTFALSSPPGEGTVIEFRIPCAEEHAGE